MRFRCAHLHKGLFFIKWIHKENKISIITVIPHKLSRTMNFSQLLEGLMIEITAALSGSDISHCPITTKVNQECPKNVILRTPPHLIIKDLFKRIKVYNI